MSVYLLWRVDMVIRYIEVNFTFGLPDYVRYIGVRYIEVLFHTVYCNFGRDIEYRTPLNRGSLNRDRTVLIRAKFTVSYPTGSVWKLSTGPRAISQHAGGHLCKHCQP